MWGRAGGRVGVGVGVGVGVVWCCGEVRCGAMRCRVIPPPPPLVYTFRPTRPHTSLHQSRRSHTSLQPSLPQLHSTSSSVAMKIKSVGTISLLGMDKEIFVLVTPQSEPTVLVSTLRTCKQTQAQRQEQGQGQEEQGQEGSKQLTI